MIVANNMDGKNFHLMLSGSLTPAFEYFIFKNIFQNDSKSCIHDE